ncbi:MAG: radical SAM protein [Candidatus Helarchaeota archaeon]
MDSLSHDLFECDEKSFLNYQNKALKIKLKNFGSSLWCYAPSLLYYSIDQFERRGKYKFVSISITGKKCQLQCEHCRGKILDSMYPAETPMQLYTLVKDFVDNEGCKGILISGGAKINGSVPLLPFIDTIKKIKEELKIEVIIHTGIITKELARALSLAKIDAVMLDVLGHDETIHQVYHLEKTVEDYEKSLSNLVEHNIPFVPHILLGLDYGKIKGELYALKLVRRYKPLALVIIVLMPIEGTPMEYVDPVSPKMIARFITYTRFLFPDIPIMLGCARPKGDHKVKTDILAIQSGINGIAYLCQDAADFAIKNGYNLKFSDLCCSLVYKEIQR